MYERFYGFKERPFSLLPDPDFLYLGQKHQAALDLLELTIFNQSGFCVMSGEIGAGKTTLIRELLNRLGEDICVGLISNTHPSFGELLQWIMSAYGLQCEADDKFELHKCFLDYVIQQYADGKRTLLIIDEAQNLSVSTLEELRMLSNVNSDKDLLLQIILVGQKQLRDKLTSPELEQFAQRIAVDSHLTGLDEKETFDYIRYRVIHAGGAADLFGEDACRTVYRCSDGIPRLINGICNLSLVYGYSEKSPVITPELVRTAVNDQRTGNIRKPHGHLSLSIPALDPEDVKTPDDSEPEGVDAATAGTEVLTNAEEWEPSADDTPAVQATAHPQEEDRGLDVKPAAVANAGQGPTQQESATIVGSMNPILLQGGLEPEGAQTRAQPRSTAAKEAPTSASPLQNSGMKRRQTGLLLASALVVLLGVAVWWGRGLWTGLPVAETIAADSPAQAIPQLEEVQQVQQQEAARKLVEQREARRLAERQEAERKRAQQREAQRLAERQEAERKLAQQREAQRLAEQQEAERKQAQQREAQRLVEQQEAERKLTEQREAELKLARQREAARRAEEARLARIEQQKAAQEAERREWERLARIQREAELDMAKRRAAIRRAQESQKTGRQRAEQREQERLARIQRQAAESDEKVKAVGTQRPTPKQSQKRATDRKQATKSAGQDIDARRAAAQAMWDKLGDEPEWSDESEGDTDAPPQQTEQDAYLKALERKAAKGDAWSKAKRAAAARAAWNNARSEIEWAEESGED